MPYIYSGRVLKTGRAWKDNNGVVHPKTWATSWTQEEMASFGVVWQEPSPADQPFDNRFYWGRNADGSLIPKNIEDVAEVDENGDPVLDEDGVQVITKGLKSQAVSKIKTQAGALLAPTDWMIIRGVEDPGKPASLDVKGERAAIRAKSDEIEAAINACTTLEEFIALHDIPTDVDGNPTGNAPIADWPEV